MTITEIIYNDLGGIDRAKTYSDQCTRAEYFNKVFGTEYSRIVNVHISYDDVFTGWRAIPIEFSAPVDLKNQFHNIIQLFDVDGFKLIQKKGWFGKAYCNACLRASNGRVYNLCLPDAKMIFEELSKLLHRAEANGFIIDDEVRQYMKR